VVDLTGSLLIETCNSVHAIMDSWNLTSNVKSKSRGYTELHRTLEFEYSESSEMDSFRSIISALLCIPEASNKQHPRGARPSEQPSLLILIKFGRLEMKHIGAQKEG
jgi:hypothetical protein